MKITPDKIIKLSTREVFVFGSNLAGIPGAGAAKYAQKFGMIYGHTVGHIGQVYAIPTKDHKLNTLNLNIIQNYVCEFIEYAKSQTERIFLVTEIGCGLAGYKPENIAPLFLDAIDIENIYLPKRFWDIIIK